MNDFLGFEHIEVVEHDPKARWWWMTQREARWFSAGVWIGGVLALLILGLGKLVS